MNTNQNHIFDRTTDTISQKDIGRYLSGQMSNEEQYEVELLMESNPFVADAIEGYQAFPDTTLPDVNDHKGFSFGKTTFLWAVFGVLVIVGVGYYYTSNSLNNDDSTANIQPTVVDANPIQESNPETVEIIESHYSDSSIQVIASGEKPKHTSTQITEKFAKKEEAKKPLDPIEPIALDPSKVIDSVKANKVSKKVVQPNVFNTYHIVDYTVYNYRGIREEPIQTLPKAPTGTPASQANKNSKVDHGISFEQVYYDEYLKEAIVLFSQKKYSKAEKKFLTILKKYPEDVNALFYISMCAFNSENYEDAIIFFTNYLEQPLDLFGEDAYFFRALSYVKSGQKAQGIQQLERIVAAQGFYADQANKLLMDFQ